MSIPVNMIALTLLLLLTSCYANQASLDPVTRMDDAANLELDQGNYENAIKLYKNIMAIPVHEAAPNLRYIEIANAYYLNAESDKAGAYLEKAGIAIHLQAGLYECNEAEQAPEYLITDFNNEILQSDKATEVASHMCNYFTLGDYYRPDNLDMFLHTSERIKAYKRLRRLLSTH